MHNEWQTKLPSKTSYKLQMGILPVEIELVADARRKLNERICQLYNKDVQDEIYYGFVQFQTRQREFV